MDKRVIKTKEAIRTAYFALLFETNFSKVTITEIAKKANIDRKTFYLHYESIEDLEIKLMEERYYGFYKKLDEENFFTTPINSRLFFRILNEDIKNNIDAHRYVANNKNIADITYTVMTKLFLDKRFNKEARLNVKDTVIARFYVAGVIYLYKSYLKGELDISLDEISEIASNIFDDYADKIF